MPQALDRAMARSYIAVLLLLVAAAAVVAAAEARNVTCPQQPLAPGRYEFSFEYEGLERYVPIAQTRDVGGWWPDLDSILFRRALVGVGHAAAF